MKQKFSLHGKQVVDSVEISDFNKVGDDITFTDVTINDLPATLIMMARNDGFCLRIIVDGKYETDIYCVGENLNFDLRHKGDCKNYLIPQDVDVCRGSGWFNKGKRVLKLPIYGAGRKE